MVIVFGAMHRCGVGIAFLSPAIVDANLAGTNIAAMDGKVLAAPGAVPIGWAVQGWQMLVGACSALLPGCARLALPKSITNAAVSWGASTDTLGEKRHVRFGAPEFVFGRSFNLIRRQLRALKSAVQSCTDRSQKLLFVDQSKV